MGVDIPVFTFDSLTPKSKLGPFGYSFGLNSNGFAIWHPDLWTVANYLEDPGNFLNGFVVVTQHFLIYEAMV